MAILRGRERKKTADGFYDFFLASNQISWFTGNTGALWTFLF